MCSRGVRIGLVILAALAPTFVWPTAVEAGSQVRLTPADPVAADNCIPFGNNTAFGFSGFIYRNIPAFSLERGDRIAFDLGNVNNRVVRRDIYLSAANKNPDEAELDGLNVVSQGITATEWVEVSADDHAPLLGRGNLVIGDYDLRYRVESDFTFPGGGLIIGFASSPPADYPDTGCEPVVPTTVSHDSSGYFYARFCLREHLDMGILDEAGACYGNGVALTGVVIGADPPG